MDQANEVCPEGSGQTSRFERTSLLYGLGELDVMVSPYIGRKGEQKLGRGVSGGSDHDLLNKQS